MNVFPRAKLQSPPGKEIEIYGSGDITRPLRENPERGITFPYTPIINFSTNTDYQQLDLVHVNDVQNFFVKRQNISLNIDAQFTAQNSREAHYSLAVIHCLTSLNMMRFGMSDPLRGLPPPIMLFSAYGDYVFNKIPVIMESMNVTFDNASDLVEVVNIYNPSEILGYINTQFRISIVLRVQRSPTKMLKEFNLDEFRSGELLKKGFR